MLCFSTTAINENGAGALIISPKFPPLSKLATNDFAPQLDCQTTRRPDTCRASSMFLVPRGTPSFESNQFAWLTQAKNLSGHFLSRRYPAARDLCGNGPMHKTYGQNRRCL